MRRLIIIAVRLRSNKKVQNLNEMWYRSLTKHLPHKEILDLSHHNTLFSQTLSFIPRHIFQKLEHRHKTGRSSRKFDFKEQFTVMAFIQLAARRSIRMACVALRLSEIVCTTGD